MLGFGTSGRIPPNPQFLHLLKKTLTPDGVKHATYQPITQESNQGNLKCWVIIEESIWRFSSKQKFLDLADF